MDEAKYRIELIHTAATVVSALEDLAVGKAGSSPAAQDLLIAAILEERKREDRRWGEIHHTPETWLKIIGEELGEAVEELGRDFLFSRAVDLDRAANSLTPLRHCSALALLAVAGRECKAELGGV